MELDSLFDNEDSRKYNIVHVPFAMSVNTNKHVYQSYVF